LLAEGRAECETKQERAREKGPGGYVGKEKTLKQPEDTPTLKCASRMRKIGMSRKVFQEKRIRKSVP